MLAERREQAQRLVAHWVAMDIWFMDGVFNGLVTGAIWRFPGCGTLRGATLNRLRIRVPQVFGGRLGTNIRSEPFRVDKAVAQAKPSQNKGETEAPGSCWFL